MFPRSNKSMQPNTQTGDQGLHAWAGHTQPADGENATARSSPVGGVPSESKQSFRALKGTASRGTVPERNQANKHRSTPVDSTLHLIGDIGAMARCMLARVSSQRTAERLSFSNEGTQPIDPCHCPTDIRELEHVIDNVAALCESATIQRYDQLAANVDPAQLDFGSHTRRMSPSPYVGKTLSAVEREAFVDALRHNNGNKAQTARDLGISVRSVYNKIRRYGLCIDKSLITIDEHN